MMSFCAILDVIKDKQMKFQLIEKLLENSVFFEYLRPTAIKMFNEHDHSIHYHYTWAKSWQQDVAP